MRRFLVGLVGTFLACGAVTGNVAQAHHHRHGCYDECAPRACEASCGCTSYRVEKQTCYRTVYERVCHPETYTVNSTVYETVYEKHPETCYRTVYETQYRDQQYTVCKQVCETSSRTETYTTQHPVYETKYRECSYTVQKPVWSTEERQCTRLVPHTVVETVNRQVCRTVVDRVTETVNTERCYTVQKPVTTYSTVCKDVGHWETQTVHHPGPVVTQCVCDCCGCCHECQVQCPGYDTCCRVWKPQIVTEQVPCTTYHCEVVRQTVPVQVVRCVPRTITENVPYPGLPDRVPAGRPEVPGSSLPLRLRAEGGAHSLPGMPHGLRAAQPAGSGHHVPHGAGSQDLQSRLLRAEAGCVHRRTLRGPLRLEGRAGDLHADGGAVRGEAGSLRGLPDRCGSSGPVRSGRLLLRRPRGTGSLRDPSSGSGRAAATEDVIISG